MAATARSSDYVKRPMAASARSSDYVSDTLFTAIDARLDAIHAELNALRADFPGGWDMKAVPRQRPRTAPTRSPASARAAMLVGGAPNSEHVLLHMAPFSTKQMRDPSKAPRKTTQRPSALGATQSNWDYRPHQGVAGGGWGRPGQHQIGYRGLSSSDAFRSSPAYTIRKKIVLSRRVDPLLADDGPGPGEYDTAKY